MVSIPSRLPLLALPALAGLISHLAYFIRGEHHQHTHFYVFLFNAVTIGISSLQIHLYSCPLRLAIVNTVWIMATYVIALFSSIIIYRVFLHPLRRFPGPRLLSLSKFGHAFMSRKLDNHRQMDKLHRQYGDFVRTGPNEITIFTPEAYAALHGPQSKCTKSDWYDVLKPNNSLHSSRVKAFHGKQKRIWDRAFSPKGV